MAVFSLLFHVSFVLCCCSEKAVGHTGAKAGLLCMHSKSKMSDMHCSDCTEITVRYRLVWRKGLLVLLLLLSNSVNKCVKELKCNAKMCFTKTAGKSRFFSFLSSTHFLYSSNSRCHFSLIMPRYHMLLLFVEDVSFRENNLDSSIFQATIH